jgi:hypothetical protein
VIFISKDGPGEAFCNGFVKSGQYQEIPLFATGYLPKNDLFVSAPIVHNVSDVFVF